MDGYVQFTALHVAQKGTQFLKPGKSLGMSIYAGNLFRSPKKKEKSHTPIFIDSLFYLAFQRKKVG